MKIENIEKEIESVVEYDLLDNLLFYGNECEKEQREEVFEEFEKQCIKLIRQVKKELEESEEE